MVKYNNIRNSNKRSKTFFCYKTYINYKHRHNNKNIEITHHHCKINAFIASPIVRSESKIMLSNIELIIF